MTIPSPAEADGRRLRSERSREAVVDALLELYAEGNLDPGAAEVAARAGVSQRTVFRLFEDLEDLAATTIERQWSRVAPSFDAPDATGPRDARVAALVDQRLRIYDAVGAVARAAMFGASRSPTIANAVAFRRDLLSRQVEAQLAPELDARRGTERTELLAALGASTSLEQVEQLRQHMGLSKTRARAVMLRTVLALLDDPNHPEASR